MNIIEGPKIDEQKVFSGRGIEKIRSYNLAQQKKEPLSLPKHFHLLISSVFAATLALGSVIWFYLLIYLITRFRRFINLKVINWLIYSLGIILCLFGVYFGYLAVKMIFFS
jgi:hypothetical protein